MLLQLMGGIRSLGRLTNRLWFRLTLAFTLIVLLGVIIEAVIGTIEYIQKIEQAEGADVFAREADYQFTRPGGVLEAVHQVYENTQSWDGIEDIFIVVQSFNPPNYGLGISYTFWDADGNLRYDSRPTPEEDIWEFEAFDKTYDITYEGEVVGKLNTVLQHNLGDPVETDSSFDYFLASFRNYFEEDFIRTIGIGTMMALLFGFVISRTLTAPLRQLADAAEAFGLRDFSSRAPVKGSTEIRQLATAFNLMADKIESGESLRRNLVADVAHELRTPLSVLQGNLRAILDDVYPLTTAEVAGLYDQTRLLSRLVNDLHLVAQAEARKLPMENKSVNLSAMVNQLAGTFIPVAEADGIRLEIDIPPQIHVQGDQARLSQVIQNLLTNALHHTPDGGLIRIGATCEEGTMRLAVSDTGSGIAAEHLPHVFERFYRADRSRRRDTGGAGLGLAISRAIVEAHGGQISASSEGIPGKGTTFDIQLPCENRATRDEMQDERVLVSHL